MLLYLSMSMTNATAAAAAAALDNTPNMFSDTSDVNVMIAFIPAEIIVNTSTYKEACPVLLPNKMILFAEPIILITL